MFSEQSKFNNPNNYIELLNPYQIISSNFLAEIKLIQVNDLSYKKACDLKKQVTNFLTTSNRNRLELTRPLDNLKKLIKEKAEEVLEPAENSKIIITQKILDYEFEKEKQKALELLRIKKICDNFIYKQLKTTELSCLELLKSIQNEYQILPVLDQENIDVKQAIIEIVKRVNERIAQIKEKEANDKKNKELAEIKASQDKEAFELAKKQAELDKQVRDQKEQEAKIIAENARLDLEKQKALKDKQEMYLQNSAPKSGIKTYITFEIINADLVPKEFCSPDKVKINEGIKARITIPGIKLRTYQK